MYKNKKTTILCIVIILITAVFGGTLTFLPPNYQSAPDPVLPLAAEVVDTETPNPVIEIETASGPEPIPEPSLEPEPAPEPESVPEQEPIPQASDITDVLTVTLSDGRQPNVLLDRSYTTRLVFGSEAYMTVTAPEDIYSLYLIWGLPPGQWSLSGLETQTFGDNGFIHEYVTPGLPAGELTLRLPPSGATLCGIYAFSEGTPPDWVQTWLPPHDRADMLVLPTHADDEHLFFAGLLPYYAGEKGYRVQVAYLTNHWNEPPRPHEQLNGLWTVGIRHYPVISGFNDRYAESLAQARNIYGFDNFVNFQVELLRRFKPYVVVGHDLNGEYGHGVHMLGAHALREAVENAADSARHTESYHLYGVWDTPKLYLHLYPQNVITMDWDVPLENFGGATAYEMAVAGYGAHLSQHRWSFSVPRPGSTSGHRFGLVRSLVGEDRLGGDMFENIIGQLT